MPQTMINTELAAIKVRSDFNPRQEAEKANIEGLAASIKERGLLQPLVCDSQGFLIDGHRRYLACVLLDLDQVPVLVKDYMDDAQRDSEQLIDAITTATQREQLSPVEEAAGYRALKDQRYSVKEIAAQMGVPQQRIKDRLALNALPAEVQALFSEGKLTAGHVKPLTELAKASAALAVDQASRWAEDRLSPQELLSEPIVFADSGQYGTDLWYVRNGYLHIGKLPLSEKATGYAKQLKALGREANHLTFEAPDVAAGIQLGVIVAPGFDEETTKTRWGLPDFAIVSDAYVNQVAEEAFLALLTKITEVKKADAKNAAEHAGTVDSPDEVREADGTVRPKTEEELAEDRRLARAADLKERRAAMARNLDAGKLLTECCDKVKVDRDLAVSLAGMILELAGQNKVVDNGIAYLLPQFVGTKGEGEKEQPTSDNTAARRFAATWVSEGKTPGAVIGRALAILGAPALVDASVASLSARPGNPRGEWASEALEPMREHLKPVKRLGQVEPVKTRRLTLRAQMDTAAAAVPAENASGGE